jgi:hypothetical protein
MVALVMLMSVFFTVWEDSFSAKILATFAIYLALVPLTFLAFRSGLWLDFALPLLAVQLYDAFLVVRDLLCGAERSQSNTSDDS